MKSENIFVSEVANEKPVFLIGDFDTSKRTSSEKAKTTIGTPCFIAPEVFCSDNTTSYTSKADGKVTSMDISQC